MRTKIQFMVAVMGAMVGVAAIPAHSQQATPSPAFPVLSRLYGPVDIYVPEAVMVSPVPLNPALQGSMADYGQNRFVEGDFGKLTLQHGPAVSWYIANYGSKLGRGYFRVSANHFSSTNGQMPITAPADIKVGGDSLEFVYGQPVDKHLSLGIAILPIDHGSASLSVDQLGTIATGSTKAGREYRIGGLYKYGQFAAGYEQGDEHGRIFTNYVGGPSVDGDYDQKHATAGIRWTPALGSTLFYNAQWIRISSNDFGARQSSKLDTFGIEQALSRSAIIRFTRSGTADAISVTAIAGSFSVTTSYTDRAFSSLESTEGRGKLFFLDIVMNR